MTYTSAERMVIRQFAAGDETKREQAHQLYDRTLDDCRRTHSTLPHTNDYFNFLSEAFSPCPDYLLRHRYRAAVKGDRS